MDTGHVFSGLDTLRMFNHCPVGRAVFVFLENSSLLKVCDYLQIKCVRTGECLVFGHRVNPPSIKKNSSSQN